LDKEENQKLLEVVLQLFLDLSLNAIDANEPDVADYHYIPNTISASENIKSCLQVTIPFLTSKGLRRHS
jgi:intraflagellar transport protein 52